MKRLLIGASALALALVLAACSQQASLSVSLGSASGSVVRGDHVSVPVTVSNASGTVNLSVSGAPSGVTASLASTTLSGGATSTTLDVQVSAAAAEGTTTLTVDAAEGSNAASATYDVTITSLSVHGTVVGLLGVPVSGAIVSIQGTNATTASDGSFTIGGVAVPYDLDVVQTVSTTTFAHVFQGLTTASPTVMPVTALSAPGGYQNATINGTLGSAVPTGSVARVCVAGVSKVVFGCTSVSAGGTTFSLTATWATGANANVTVRALEVQTDANGIATGYGGYGTANASLTSGVTTPVTVNFGAAPSTATLTASTNVPAGFTLNTLSASASLDALSSLSLFSTSAVSSFSAVVPQFAGASYNVLAIANPSGSGASIGWKASVAGGGSVTLTLPTPPAQIAPADGATGIGVGSTLSVASAGGAAVTFLVQGSGQQLAITTVGSSVTIPDLTALGFTLASATNYTWSAIVSPTETTAAGAAQGWIADYYDAVLANSGGPAPAADGAIMATTSRGFTTP